MQREIVVIDVESVRSQLSSELCRPVSDLEVGLWLGRCGYRLHNGQWVAEVTQSSRRFALGDTDNSGNWRQQLNAF